MKGVLFCRLVRNRVEKLLELLASLVAEGEPMPGINVVRYVVGRIVGEPDLSLIVLPYAFGGLSMASPGAFCMGPVPSLGLPYMTTVRGCN